MRIYKHTYIIYTYIHTYTHMHTRTYVCTSQKNLKAKVFHLYIYVCVCVHVFMYYVCSIMYVFMYVCMYFKILPESAYSSTHTYSHTRMCYTCTYVASHVCVCGVVQTYLFFEHSGCSGSLLILSLLILSQHTKVESLSTFLAEKKVIAKTVKNWRLRQWKISNISQQKRSQFGTCARARLACMRACV